MSDDGYERFAKWQGITRDHLGATSNLILGLATGLLGFEIALLLDGKLGVRCSRSMALAALVLLAASVAMALWCAMNRLSDFRFTAKIANPNTPENQREGLREQARILGERTWLLFRIQVWAFALGTAATGVSVAIQILVNRCAGAA